MDKEELEEILAKHKLWLAGDSKGERANLKNANLCDANLKKANLYGANFYGANLRGANLIGADLYLANLVEANLIGADLRGANLYRANLYRANLYRANLRDTDLHNANLRGANLRMTKGIISFTAGKHLAFYTPHNKYLKIGCEGHEVDYWLEKYKSIGKDSNYSDQEIKAYGGFIKLCAEVGAHK